VGQLGHMGHLLKFITFDAGAADHVHTEFGFHFFNDEFTVNGFEF
jgi:hypothetical protein